MDIEKIISEMTLEDKIALCEGANFWETKVYDKYGIPAMFVCDGPSGLRRQDLSGGTDMLGVNASRPATCFPAGVTTANSWDPDLMQLVGSAIGEEARSQGVGVVLGPGANLKRNPLCGRNFEYYSEDPLLAGLTGAALVKGIQSNGVSSCVKHFAVNNKETNRKHSDSRVSQRALREIYLKAFEIIVKTADPWAIMSSYNVINGHRASECKDLLEDILRGEWDFQGVVTTDWWTRGEHYKEILAGNDVKMATGFPDRVKEAQKLGVIGRKDYEHCVKRVLEMIMKLD